jgi:hypothetical protein
LVIELLTETAEAVDALCVARVMSESLIVMGADPSKLQKNAWDSFKAK